MRWPSGRGLLWLFIHSLNKCCATHLRIVHLISPYAFPAASKTARFVCTVSFFDLCAYCVFLSPNLIIMHFSPAFVLFPAVGDCRHTDSAKWIRRSRQAPERRARDRTQPSVPDEAMPGQDSTDGRPQVRQHNARRTTDVLAVAQELLRTV